MDKFYILKNLSKHMKLKSEADCGEAICCNIVTKNSTLTIGVVYHSPILAQEEDVKLQKPMWELSKGNVL